MRAKYQSREIKKRYIAFHKPYGVLSQFTSELGQRTLADFQLPPHLYAAGRLDKDSEGLLLLTNDGPLINRLLDPGHHHPRTYWAQVEGTPNSEALLRLQKGGISLSQIHHRTRPCVAKILDRPPDLPERIPPIRFRQNIPTTWMELILTEGKNRQVRRMTAAIGHPTLRLMRVGIGQILLGNLGPGEWRELQQGEIFAL